MVDAQAVRVYHILFHGTDFEYIYGVTQTTSEGYIWCPFDKKWIHAALCHLVTLCRPVSGIVVVASNGIKYQAWLYQVECQHQGNKPGIFQNIYNFYHKSFVSNTTVTSSCITGSCHYAVIDEKCEISHPIPHFLSTTCTFLYVF